MQNVDNLTSFIINGHRDEDGVVGCLRFGIFKVSNIAISGIACCAKEIVRNVLTASSERHNSLLPFNF